MSGIALQYVHGEKWERNQVKETGSQSKTVVFLSIRIRIYPKNASFSILEYVLELEYSKSRRSNEFECHFLNI